MGAALGWGALASSSLIIGGFLGLARPWSARIVGLVLAFGAGALISAVSFDLAQEGARVGGPGYLAIGLAAGALTYYSLDRIIERPGHAGGAALTLGALLDGIPEQMVLGIGIASGEGVGVGLLVAIFVSNLPEAIGGSLDLLKAGHSAGSIRRTWIVLAVICTLASCLGYALADATAGHFQALIDGVAAGALLVMLIDSMVPEARERGGLAAGLVTVLGFAVAAGLSGIT